MDANDYDESQHVLAQLQTFLSSATNTAYMNTLQLTEIGLSLLTSLPTSRDAVLEYLGIVFHETVVNYLNAKMSGKRKLDSDACTEDPPPIVLVRECLCGFIAKNPSAWSPILSSWSLKLLGNISSQCAYHPRLNQTSFGECLQLWMSCPATRTLVDINTRSLSSLLHTNSDACINALLDISVAHNQGNFDWVVAHVGSCFPKVIINRVLTCGLKDFISWNTEMQNARLTSVKRILQYLGTTHFADVKEATFNLFRWSQDCPEFDYEEVWEQRFGVVPYLLGLGRSSKILLNAIASVTIANFSAEAMMKLSHRTSQMYKFYHSGREGMLNMVIDLLLALNENIYRMLSLLIDTATSHDPKMELVAKTAREIIDLLIDEIDLILSRSHMVPPLLRAIGKQLNVLLAWLISDNREKSLYATQFISVMGGRNVTMLSRCIGYVISNTNKKTDAFNLLELTSTCESVTYFAQCLPLVLADDSMDTLNMDKEKLLVVWENIRLLLDWEITWKSSGVAIVFGLLENLEKVTNCLQTQFRNNDLTTARVITQVVNQLLTWPLPRAIAVMEAMSLCQAIVSYFFRRILRNNGKRCAQVRFACHTLQTICQHSPPARCFAVRLLAETALRPPMSKCFGAVIRRNTCHYINTNHSLLRENILHGDTLSGLHGRMSVIRAGWLGNASRNKNRNNGNEDGGKAHRENSRELLAALHSCCVYEPYLYSDPEVAKTLSLLLVELISTDIMFNGLPWPEEDASKVTIERDLAIRHKFDSAPILWTMLRFLALQRPALCLVSVLLRAITSTLINNWTAANQGRVQIAGLADPVVITTIKLIEVLQISQLLPYPLYAISHIIPYIEPHNVLLLLRECVWNYMRLNVPSPALYAHPQKVIMRQLEEDYFRPNKLWRNPCNQDAIPENSFVEPFRVILLDNVDKFAELYFQLFVKKPQYL